jgi:tetratricopeptide (TPR) repeat protein
LFGDMSTSLLSSRAQRLWTALATTVLVLELGACHPPAPTCDPDRPDCDDAHPKREPVLSEVEAREQLATLHERYTLAAAEGLDPAKCRSLADAYRELYELDPTVIAARFNQAAVWEACGELERAESIYAELVDREHPQALNNLGVLAWSRGEHGRAFTLFERAVAADRTHALEARNNLAMALRERYAERVEIADFQRAEAQLQNILAVDSSNKAAYENLARLYYDRGRLDDASYLVLADLVVTQAQRILEARGQQSADLHNLRGLLLMQDDDQVRALREFQRAVALEPDHVDGNRNIAMIAIRFRDYGEAERALERVIGSSEGIDGGARAGTRADTWLALGVAKRGLRKYEDAAAAYRRAAELDRADPRPWYNLGVLAQDHLAGHTHDEALTAIYADAQDHYQTFIAQAQGSQQWAAAVRDAHDRIAIVKDSIETIETMHELEEQVRELEEQLREREAEERRRAIERSKQLEAQAISVDELLEQ